MILATLATDAPAQSIFASAESKPISFEALVDSLVADADIVFVGEQHDDPATHVFEAQLFEALQKKRPRIVLSLEMFERDTQTALDAYLSGSSPEKDFLAVSRPWPNYATDYRPLVELAKASSVQAIAANVPRRLASKVAKGGLTELASLPPGEGQWVAADAFAPRDAYWLRFKATMSGHGGVEPAAMFRFYEAQVLKDETMAESIARSWSRARSLVVHYNGAFHSDHGLGTVARVRRRIPSAAVVTVTVVPVEDPAKANPAGEAGRADYVVFVSRPAKK
jgi:uncharacterized iron-regulated protein